MKKLKQAKDDFSLVVENAFDFFKKSLDEFDKEPKYSVIHFHAGIELIMKARLLWEHWTLILTRPDNANLQSFRSGDFQSVSIKDAKVRLESIVQDGLNPAEYECFLRLSDHRNRMVHFYHPGSAGNKTELEKIVAEQCLAWYHLSRILKRWRDQFESYSTEIARIDKAMHKHGKYLNTKFGALAAEIKRFKDRGITFTICPSCHFESFREDADDVPILDYECLVCEVRETGLMIECPQCGEQNRLIGDPWHRCTKCTHKLNENDVRKFLTKNFVYDKHDPDRSIVAHCEECEGYETVVQVNGRWICSLCFAKYNSKEIGRCDCCGSLSTGNLEDSYFRGCVGCDGMASRESD